MKVLMLSPDLGYGGAHLSFAKVSALLSGHHQVFCCVFNSDSRSNYDFPGKLHVLDQSVRPWLRGFSLGRFVGRLIALRKIKSNLQIDVTISFLEGADYVNFFSGGPGKRFAAIRGSKLRDQEISGMRGSIRKWIMRSIYPLFDRVLPVSAGLAREMAVAFKVPEDRLSVTPNFYSHNQLDEQISQSVEEPLCHIFDSRRCFVNIGRLHVSKNLRFLIRAFYKLRLKRSDIRLVLIGSGPAHEELKQLCDALGLINWSSKDSMPTRHEDIDVCFLGFQKNPLALASRGAAFVFPSLYEGFPNALVEAMMCSLPVVTSDCDHGPREILGLALDAQIFGLCETKAGFLAPVPDELNDDDQALWCAAMNIVVGAKRREMGLQARKRALHYAGPGSSMSWLDVLRSESLRS